MKIQNYKKKLISVFLILAIAIIMYVLKIPCLFKMILGIECPSCGITRAYISLLKLDFAKAFAYNKLFWIVPLCFLFYFFDGKIFKRKWLNTFIEVVFFLLIFANWIFLKL